MPAPLLVSRPMMTNGIDFTRTMRPMGFSGPNNCVAVFEPMMATLAAVRTSRSVNIVPAARSQLRMDKYCADSPEICVDQLWPLAMAWPAVRTSGLTAITSGTSRPIASASASVSVLPLPRPALTPELLAAAGKHHQQILAERGNPRFDGRPRAVADGDHRHHRRDADDDAEAGQRRTQLVPAQRPQREPRGARRADENDLQQWNHGKSFRPVSRGARAGSATPARPSPDVVWDSARRSKFRRRA